MYATNYLENIILNLFRGQTTAAPSGLFIALFHSNPSETGQAGVEASYAGYNRMPITFSVPAPLNEGIGFQNAGEITFPITPTALSPITHAGIMDSSTGGNMLLYSEFAESLNIAANEAPVMVAGELQWWMSGNVANSFKTRVLNFIRGTSLSGFTPYIALYNGDPEQGGSELSGGNYSRIPVAFSAPAQQAGGHAVIANSNDVSFERAASAWGMWTHTAIFDAANSGNITFVKSIAPAKEIRRAVSVLIKSGELQLSVD